MNAFMNEVFAIFGMIFSFGLLVAGILKTVRYFSNLNEFKKDTLDKIYWIKKEAESKSDKIFKAEKQIEVLGQCDNKNRDNQKEIEKDVSRLYERQNEMRNFIEKLCQKNGAMKVDIERFSAFETEADKKIAELETRLNQLTAEKVN